MEYNQKEFEDGKLPMTCILSQEANQSSTVEIDLAEYLPLFKAANTGKIARGSQEYIKFQSAHAELFGYFRGMGSVSLMEDMKEACLKRYSEEERVKIINSPAYTLLHDSFRELLKNSVDVFLEHHLEKPDDKSTKIKFNFDVQAYDDRVSLIFSDSGTGFSPETLKNLENESEQLKYIETHQSSKKRGNGTVGLLGGGGFGLRQLIHQVLTGKELKPGITLPRSTLFDSKILFSNGTNQYCRGGSIAMTTSVAPIPDLENEAITTIETHLDSKMASSLSPVTTVSEDSIHSSSSETIALDALNHLDLGENVKSKKGGLGLVLDIPERDTSRMFAGNSPMPPKETPKFDNFSPVVQEKQNKGRGETKFGKDARPAVLQERLSKTVDQSKSRTEAEREQSSFDTKLQLIELQRNFKNKIVFTREGNEKSQKSNSDQDWGPKKTS